MMQKTKQNIGFPLFKLIDKLSIDDVNLGEVIFQDTFFLTQISSNKCKLILTPTHIAVISNENVISAVRINFQLKFQTIFAEKGNSTFQKIGFRLFHQYINAISFYSENYQKLNIWILYLASKINQRGFNNLFKPIQKLGKGNFAAVYEVIRLEDKKRFAVKAFSKINSFSARNGKQSLISQLSILRKLNHKNVIHLEGVYQSQNSIYVVLEMLEGGQLLNKVTQKGGIFTQSETKQFMQGLLKGLKHIHSLRIMHRDLKPENILLRNKSSMEPVIVDFGLATLVDIDQYLFFRCGTPGYVAPEIIKLSKNEHIEPLCDIFSAGVIFHILLTGKPLFSGQNYDQVYRKNRNMQFNLSTPAYTHINPQARDLLAKMLKEDPKDRINANDALQHQYFDREDINEQLRQMYESSKNNMFR